MNQRKKISIITGSSLLSLLLAAGLLYLLTRPHAPDPAKIPAKDAVKYLASKQFASLSEKEQEDYFNKLRSGKGDNPGMFFSSDLSQAERAAMFKNTRKLMFKEMKQRMNKFFAMSKEEQDKELDKIIKEREDRMKAGGIARTPGGPPPGGPPSKAMIQNMLENSDSTSRAQMSEFFKRMEQRTRERK
ncbi:MAG: hypothetical protein ACYC4Q_07735 [Victivallaceae bacterium]